MRISLDHAHLFCSDINRTLHFLQTMFDAELVWDEEAAGVRNVRLALGRSFIHLYEQPPRTAGAGTVHHLGIETDDLDALVQRMTAQGFTFRNPIRDTPRFRYVMVAAPDNLLIELFQCLEPARWKISE
jgi:catechol 2,3-dioxygenase-like lactoylglutathione lyase family enzyme